MGPGRGGAYDGPMKRYALLAVLVVATLAAVAAVWWSMRPSAPAASVPEVDRFEYQADTRPTVEVYGDSISYGASPHFGGGDLGELSWVKYAGGKDGLRFVGGFARPGMKMTEAAAEASTIVVPQQTASTVVVELGTNDINTGAEWNDFAEALEDFTSHLDVEPSDIVVVGVGPIDRLGPDQVAAWNAKTEALADENGWQYTWPFEDLMDEDGTWKDDLTLDGLHPNSEGAEIMGQAVVEAITE